MTEKVNQGVWASLETIDRLVMAMLADADESTAQCLQTIAHQTKMVRGRLANQDWDARKDEPYTPSLKTVLGMIHSEVEVATGRLCASTNDLTDAAEHASEAIDACGLDVANYRDRANTGRRGAALAAQHATETVYASGYIAGLTYALDRLESTEGESEAAE